MFGPGRAAAALEGSKTFAKRIMEVAGVPTGRATLADTVDEVGRTLDEFGAPYVVKADGLAAGKGVLVTDDRDAALAHAAHYLQQGPVLVEEFLDGQEVSLFLLSDGTHVLPLSPAQDYKRLRDGDAGPNTGGMGAYSPLPWLDDAVDGRGGRFGSEQAFVDEVIETIALPTVRRLAHEQTPFIGLLYAGLFASASPRCALRTSMPRLLSAALASRISNSGVSGGRNPAWATTGFNGTPAIPNGRTAPSCVWITDWTSLRAL